jgi:hypothetical protein
MSTSLDRPRVKTRRALAHSPVPHSLLPAPLPPSLPSHSGRQLQRHRRRAAAVQRLRRCSTARLNSPGARPPRAPPRQPTSHPNRAQVSSILPFPPPAHLVGAPPCSARRGQRTSSGLFLPFLAHPSHVGVLLLYPKNIGPFLPPTRRNAERRHRAPSRPRGAAAMHAAELSRRCDPA